MGKTVQVAADRAYDQSRTVLPAEVARGTYMQNPPGLAALKLMHLLIAKAGGRMGEDVEHRVRLSEVRGVEGLRNHDRASLAPLFAELQAAVLIHDDTEKKRLTIGGLLDIAEVDYRDELSGDLVISWYFSRMFTRAAAASNHWAILDRQTVFHLGSKYSLLLFQHIASLAKLDQVASKTFTVAELRSVLGVEPGKLERFSHFNSRAIQPAIAEINQLSRLTLTATPRKVGRTVASIDCLGREGRSIRGQARTVCLADRPEGAPGRHGRGGCGRVPRNRRHRLQPPLARPQACGGLQHGRQPHRCQLPPLPQGTRHRP